MANGKTMRKEWNFFENELEIIQSHIRFLRGEISQLVLLSWYQIQRRHHKREKKKKNIDQYPS